MKILVTGGAGFIGSHVVDRYIAEGHTVVIVDNLVTGSMKFVNPHAVFYMCDINSPILEKIFEKERPDVVNHHAAQLNVRRSIENPVYDATINILGLLHVLSYSTKYGVKRFIFISSGGAIYGDAQILPTSETSTILPLCPYGLAKYVGERYIQLFHQLYNLNYVILRYGNVYGPRQNPLGEAGVIAIFIGKMLKGEQPTIFGDGTQTRGYVYVEDVVEANILSLKKGNNQIFNIGVEREITVNDVFHMLQLLLKFPKEPLFGKKPIGEIFRSCLDCTLAKKELGWKEPLSFEEGIKRTVAWSKEDL